MGLLVVRQLLLLVTFTRLTHAQFTGDLRLVDSISTNARGAGRLEIFIQGQWGTVCDDGFDLLDAGVACRQLGYSSAESEGNVGFFNFPAANSSTRIWLDNVSCGGTDTSLLFCSHNGLGNHNCVHSEDVAIVCTGATVNSGVLRLVNSTSTNATAGRLEIYLHGEWGTVCDDGFESTEADVVCYQLGLPRSTSVGTVGSLGYHPGLSTVEIWLDNVDCSNYATTLLACNHRGIGIEDCVHSEDVAVVCGSSASNGDLRLVGSSRTGRGRLEIFLREEWGTVCDDSFGTTEGSVACRQLGYSSVSHVGNVGQLGYSQASYSAEVWLDNVDCSRYDTTLLSCSHRGIGVHNCDHSEDVALICSTSSTGGSIGGVSGGAVAGIVVAIMFAFFMGFPLLVFCIYINNIKRGNIRTRNRRRFPAAAAATAASPTGSQPVHYPTVFVASHSPQQAPPPHPYAHQQPEQPHPNSPLHKAPPPTYSQATAYPPPAYSAQSPLNSPAYPTEPSQDPQPSAHQPPQQCASSPAGPPISAPYPVQATHQQSQQHPSTSTGPPTSAPYPVQPSVQQPLSQQHTSPPTTSAPYPVQDPGYVQPNVQQPQQPPSLPSGPPASVPAQPNVQPPTTSAPYPDQQAQPNVHQPASLPSGPPTSAPYPNIQQSQQTSAPYPDQPAQPSSGLPTSAPYPSQPPQPSMQPQQPASVPSGPPPTNAPYPGLPDQPAAPHGYPQQNPQPPAVHSQQPPQNPGFPPQNPQQAAQDPGYLAYPPPTYPISETDGAPYPAP